MSWFLYKCQKRRKLTKIQAMNQVSSNIISSIPHRLWRNISSSWELSPVTWMARQPPGTGKLWPDCWAGDRKNYYAPGTEPAQSLRKGASKGGALAHFSTFYLGNLHRLFVLKFHLSPAMGPAQAAVADPDSSWPGSLLATTCPTFLLQGIFLTQGSNQGLLHFGKILYCLNHQECPNTLPQLPQNLFPPHCCLPPLDWFIVQADSLVIRPRVRLSLSVSRKLLKLPLTCRR